MELSAYRTFLLLFIASSAFCSGGRSVDRLTTKDVEAKFDQAFGLIIEESPLISPDGRSIALQVPNEEHENGLLFYDLEKWVNGDYADAVTGFRPSSDLEFIGLKWVDSEHVVSSFVHKGYRMGDVIIHRDGIQYDSLISSESLVMSANDPLKHREEHLVVDAYELEDQDVWQRQHLLKVKFDPEEGYLMDSSYKNPGDVGAWFVTRDGVPWMVFKPIEGYLYEIETRESKTTDIFEAFTRFSRWNEPKHYEIKPNSYKRVDLPGDFVKLIGNDKFALLIRANEDGFGEFLIYSRENRKVVRTIENDEGFEPDPQTFDFIYGPNGEEVGLSYFTEQWTHRWFSPKLEKLDDFVDQLLPGRWNKISGFALGDSHLLIESSSKDDPGFCALINLETHQVKILYHKKRAESAKELHDVELITFPNRDNIDIHAYLTRPNNRIRGEAEPLIVLSHGGPWLRDYPFYNPEVQFFASLGFSVLQVNYRGSTGFGRDYALFGDLLEIAEMSPLDVIDGTKFLIEQGIADPDRIVFMGASFGAFLSLAVTAIEPDLPAATVGFAGLYDINEMVKQDTKEDKMFIHQKSFASAKFAPDRAFELSPVSMVENMKAPILIVHGGKDQRVGYEQINRMAEMLKEAGHPNFKSIRYPFVHHGFAEMRQAKKYYLRVVKFLAQNTGFPILRR